MMDDCAIQHQPRNIMELFIVLFHLAYFMRNLIYLAASPVVLCAAYVHSFSALVYAAAGIVTLGIVLWCKPEDLPPGWRNSDLNRLKTSAAETKEDRY